MAEAPSEPGGMGRWRSQATGEVRKGGAEGEAWLVSGGTTLRLPPAVGCGGGRRWWGGRTTGEMKDDNGDGRRERRKREKREESRVVPANVREAADGWVREG